MGMDAQVRIMDGTDGDLAALGEWLQGVSKYTTAAASQHFRADLIFGLLRA